MTRVLALAGMVLAAAACGESKPPLSPEHVEYAKLCVDAGGEKVHCDCQATKLDELLAAGAINPDIQKAMLLAAQGKEDEADKVLAALPQSEQFEHASLVAEKQLECDAPN